MVAAVADSLEFEHEYRSVVIAWAPEDRPTDAQIEADLDEFERTVWAGIEADRYSTGCCITRTSSSASRAAGAPRSTHPCEHTTP